MFTDEDIKNIVAETEKTIGNTGRLVVRPSGTEPVIRIMIEGEDLEATVALCESTAKRIEEKLHAY